MLQKILNLLNKNDKYKHFFVYKWGFLAGAVESLLIILATFSLINLYEIYRDYEIFSNSPFLLILITFFEVIFIVISLMIVFGMPSYLVFKKKMFSTALLVLLMTIVTLFIFFTVLSLLII
ncbi:MAG: hypothetical protein PHZ07_02605 [Patescibacteria group bacterium]|nr:hypothetical protein [Patescibacteria group bacterium]MDD4304689.1 hypothetical protein [Patescibacteria group bacterium]MDD4695343.1 hypothetical protein [Patescibacteria group bacterium]